MSQILSKAKDWLADVDLESNTSEKYVYSLGLLVKSGIETTEQITRPAIKQFMVSRRRAGACAATVNYNLAAYCSFLTWLEQLGEFPLPILLELRTLYMDQAPPPPPDFLTPAQFLRLRSSSRDIGAMLDLAVAIGVHTGMRFEEIRTLWFDDFELEIAQPFVKVQRTHGRKIKTKCERTAPFSRTFGDELLRRQFTQQTGPVFPALMPGRHRSRYVAIVTLQRALRKARSAAKIRCNWITLRHTYASWLVQNNVSIAKVAKFLGNGIAICFRHYGALIPGGDLDVERGFAGLNSLAPSP